MRAPDLVTFVFAALATFGCEQELEQVRTSPTPIELQRHCEEVVGLPRIEEVVPGVWVAIAYDLANTTLIRTADGNIVVDPGMTPDRALLARRELLARAPGPVRAIIYTHSHIDHVGAAGVWAEADTEIWATEAFLDNFLDQYGELLAAEQTRGSRQFGAGVAAEHLPCSAIGPRPDIEGALRSAVRLPTDTFSQRKTLEIGGLTLELIEAHGETRDQLFVWVAARSLVLAGDNLYAAFPNLYSIRGTKPRPVDRWIDSIDAIRRLDPEYLVLGHTPPVRGRERVREFATSYRDAIRWVRDRVIQGANDGLPVSAIVERIGLPPHLAGARHLAPLYGQLDWSARAIYDGELGWFDGRPEALYPVAVPEAAAREIEMMGGASTVLRAAMNARERGDARWSVHLLAKLRDAGPWNTQIDNDLVRRELASSLEALAATTGNSNGRGYLLRTALELRGHSPQRGSPQLTDEVLASVPVERFLTIMAGRLRPSEAMDVHETVAFHFVEADQRYWLTIRRGVAELAADAALPGTPEPIATIRTDSLTWKKLALGRMSPVTAVARGELDIEGSLWAFLAFVRRFDRSLEGL